MPQASAPPINAELGEKVAGFAAYFRERAASSYDNGIPKPLIDNPHWQKPMDAIKDAFKHPWENSPGWHGIDPEKFRGPIEKWMKENHITELAPLAKGYYGWTATVFLARVKGAHTQQIVRIGTENGAMPHLEIPWNPLLLQPHSVGYMRHEDPVQRLVLSRGSVAPMVDPGKPPGFDRFMNDYILSGTPYRVKENKDWSLLSDGTPLSGDPADGLVFSDAAKAHQHANDRHNPVAQKEIMRTIYSNTRRLEKGLQDIYGKDFRLPDSMNFVVRNANGSFSTKQSLLLTDPLQQGHGMAPAKGRRQQQKIIFPHSEKTVPAVHHAVKPPAVTPPSAP
jgi:hypothetical protein